MRRSSRVMMRRAMTNTAYTATAAPTAKKVARLSRSYPPVRVRPRMPWTAQAVAPMAAEAKAGFRKMAK